MDKFSFSEIEFAFMYVSGSMYGMNTVVLHRDTGEFLYRSEMAETDEIGDRDIEGDEWVGIPHKNDLDLGNVLVFEFVEDFLPDDYERVRQIFSRAGAYSRYKDLLDQRGMLEKWYDYENSREQSALRKWCEENGLKLDDESPGHP